VNQTANKLAIIVLAFATIVFAINTFDIISIFYLIAEDFGEDVSLLGLITATLVIGIGALQIPAGIIAAKFGAKIVAILGMIVIAFSAGMTAVTSDIYQLALLRLVLGGGLAFFFPSAMVLAAEHFRRGSEALAVGVVTGSNAAGGIIGLVGWVLLAQLVGWRSSMIIGAILAAIAALAIFLVLPKRTTPGIKVKNSDLRAILTNRRLIIIGILLLGSQAGFEQVLAFMPFYLQQALAVEAPLAGLIGSVTLITALAGGPVLGLIYDKSHDLSVLVMILASGMLIGISLNILLNVPAAIASVLIVGFAGSGLFALLSNGAREILSSGKVEYTTLSINWVHAIALTGTFWAPILFSSVAIQYGYATSWATIGITSFILIVACLYARKQLKS
jgi:MFS family permease